jgi:ubiquinone/menaquinone biosynthesis C-methylase UbiE
MPLRRRQCLPWQAHRTMHRMDTPVNPYPAVHSERELERLAVQARDLAAHTTVLFRRAGISAGHRVLDLGCGPGDVSFIAAEIVGPSGHVVGVDRSPTAVETARERARNLGHLNVTFKVGDAADLAIAGEFDVIVGRLVVMYLPDPVKALRQLQRYLRPQGLVVLQEGDPRTIDSEPECPLVSQVRTWMVGALERTGCATNMGSRLASVLHQAGYRAEGSWVSQPSYVGASLARLDWFADLARSLVPALERTGIATPQIVQTETLAARLVGEASARHAIVYAPRLVGIWARVTGGFTP